MSPQPSILEGIDLGSPAPKRRRRAGSLSAAHALRPLSRAASAAWSTPAARAMTSASAAMLVVAAGIAAWLALRPVPKPDYETGKLDTIFNYTLLTDEFNRLPVEERIRLIGELVGRVRSMDSSDSVLMAAFAARITGTAREQLVENASLVMVDLTDRAATLYDPSAPPADRVRFIEEQAIEFQLAMEAMGGVVRDIPPEQRLAEMREQSERDMEAMESGDFGAEQAGRMAGFLSNTMGRHASAEQKARMTVFGRDMARVLRGQDVVTGKPLPKP